MFHSSLFRRTSRAVGSILLFIATVAASLLLLEFLVRITNLQPMDPNPGIHERSMIPGLLFELKPNLKNVPGFGGERISTDSRGFRSPEIDPKKSTIAFLGDSMVFGFGVEEEDSNPAATRRKFQDFNVINAGVASYNIEQEVLMYEAKIASLKPTLVVLEFVINDAQAKSDLAPEAGKPTEEQERILDERLRAAITQPGLWNFPGKFWLHKHSALFTFIERATKSLPFRSHASLLGQEWSKEELSLYDSWLTRLSTDIGDAKKLFVLWPDGYLYPQTKQAVQKMAESHSWLVLDLSDLFGIRYQTLIWDHHPRGSEQRKAGDVIAETIEKYELAKKN